MHEVKGRLNRVKELEALLEQSERKSDILTNLLKEASAEFEQALEGIRISEANLRAVIENAPEAIYILNMDSHQVLYCNAFTREWLGYAHEELLSKQAEDLLEPGAQGLKENIEQVRRHGLVYIQERRYLKKDGTIVDAEVNGTLITYQGEKCMLVLARDITQRKRIAELSRYEELFKNVSDPVFINDHQGHLLELNDVACQIFGYSRDDLLKKAIKDLVKDQHRSHLIETRDRINKGEIVQFEMEIVTAKGEAIPYEFHARPVTFRGLPAVLSVGRNLEFRKKLEATLIRTERITAVGEMASGVAHNFNNLLQIIIGAGEAALVKLERGKIKECREALYGILQAAGRGVDVVRRIKDFTHIQPEDRDSDEVFDLGNLLGDAVELTKPLWKDLPDGRRYDLIFTKPKGCYVKGHPSEFFEVLINLIRNALEAMPQGGTLTLAVCKQKGEINLEITDTGCGIPREHLERIFEPFFTTKGLRSSGLGLSSSYGIIKKLNGEIRLESETGQGTTFIVRLPRTERGLLRKKVERLPSPENRDLIFLVIDDDPYILKSIALYFEDSVVELTAASSAKAGLAAFQQKAFDVVLCDLGMDGLNGLDVGRAIKKYCADKKISKPPFLLYTGWQTHLDPQKIKECGVDRVIMKPIPCEKLLGLIQELALPKRPDPSDKRVNYYPPDAAKDHRD